MSDPSFKHQLGENKHGAVSAVAHAQGVSADKTYKSVGGGLEFNSVGGHSASVTADHFPGRGDKFTGAASANLVNSGGHKVDANAFSSVKQPYGGPKHEQHGAGVGYSFKNEQLKASANVAHTPMTNRTDYTLQGSANLHRTPNSSLDFNVQSNKTNNSRWNTGGQFSYRRDF